MAIGPYVLTLIFRICHKIGELYGPKILQSGDASCMFEGKEKYTTKIHVDQQYNFILMVH